MKHAEIKENVKIMKKWQNRMKNTIILKISRVQKECVLQKERIEMDSLWRVRDEKREKRCFT